MDREEWTRTVDQLRRAGYYLIPIAPGRKEPPPNGWQKRAEPYDITYPYNVAIGTRGEVSMLITNDDLATAWAMSQFGSPHVRSVRGAHWYFRPRQGQANEANRITPVGAMEFHAQNKYALVPPSIHPSGVPYQLVKPLPALSDLPEAPDIRELWHPGGTHHGELIAQSAAAAHKGKDAETIFAELAAYRDSHFTDGFAHPDRELLQMAESAVAKFQLSQTPAPPREPNLQLFDDNDRPITEAFVSAVLERFHTVTFADNEETWVYMDGRFTRGLPWAKAYLESLFAAEGKVASTRFVAEVLGAISRKNMHFRDEWGTANMLCLLNGTYDLTKRALVAHSPDHRLLCKIPVEFRPSAKCARWTAFVDSSVPNPLDREALQEVFGYCLFTGNPYQKMVMLIGPTRSGKSTILRILEGLLGRDNVSHQTLQNITGARFGAANLYGKLANTFADLPARALGDLGIIKALTGEDSQDVERKGKEFFRLTWGGKAVFSCNDLPLMAKRDDAFFTRWLCLSVPNTVDPLKRDPDLTAKLLEELPGILNWALEGLYRLQARCRFDPAIEEGGIKQLWLDTANPIRRYVRERLVTERGVDVSTESLYDDYLKWTEEVDMEPDPRRKFVDRLREETKASKCQIRVGIKVIQGFRGFRLRSGGDSPFGQTTLEGAGNLQNPVKTSATSATTPSDVADVALVAHLGTTTVGSPPRKGVQPSATSATSATTPPTPPSTDIPPSRFVDQGVVGLVRHHMVEWLEERGKRGIETFEVSELKASLSGLYDSEVISAALPLLQCDIVLENGRSLWKVPKRFLAGRSN